MESLGDDEYSLIAEEVNRLSTTQTSSINHSSTTNIPASDSPIGAESGVWSLNSRLLGELGEERRRNAELGAEVAALRHQLTTLAASRHSSLPHSGLPHPAAPDSAPSSSHVAQLLDLALTELARTRLHMDQEAAEIQRLGEEIRMLRRPEEEHPAEPTSNVTLTPSLNDGEATVSANDKDTTTSPSPPPDFFVVGQDRICPVCNALYMVLDSEAQARFEAHVDSCAEEVREGGGEGGEWGWLRSGRRGSASAQCAGSSCPGTPSASPSSSPTSRATSATPTPRAIPMPLEAPFIHVGPSGGRGGG